MIDECPTEVGDLLTTNTSLLEGLLDQGNDVLWSLFCRRYRPVIIAVGRRLGLSEPEAEDASQEALLAFANSYRDGRYQADKGRLRSWLLGIAGNKIRDVQRRRPREIAAGGDDSLPGAIAGAVDEHTLSDVWDVEWRRAVVKECLAHVRKKVDPATMRAFELLVLEEWEADRVAETLNINRNSVYQAKSRVLAHMRQIHKELESDW